jgi:hypothetical protein
MKAKIALSSVLGKVSPKKTVIQKKNYSMSMEGSPSKEEFLDACKVIHDYLGPRTPQAIEEEFKSLKHISKVATGGYLFYWFVYSALKDSGVNV